MSISIYHTTIIPSYDLHYTTTTITTPPPPLPPYYCHHSTSITHHHHHHHTTLPPPPPLAPYQYHSPPQPTTTPSELPAPVDTECVVLSKQIPSLSHCHIQSLKQTEVDDLLRITQKADRGASCHGSNFTSIASPRWTQSGIGWFLEHWESGQRSKGSGSFSNVSSYG